jgi:CMP/dCMP kinase
MSTNVVLVGMMGSGKTTVGRLLAERTGMEFIDLDTRIEDRAGRTIAEMFAEQDEDAFRAAETEALREVLAATNAVIATGGGIVTREENRKIIRDLGLVVWLDAPAETLVERVGDGEARPMLAGGNILRRLEQLLADRREKYAEASDIHLDTTELLPEEIADRIAREIEAKGLRPEDLFATIVAIDGPVGSGKSALAKRIAKRLNYVHVDTGAMYRCVTLEAMRRDVPFDNPADLAAVAHSVDIRFVDPAEMDESIEPGVEEKRVLLNGEDVTEAIRSPDVSRNTSPVADAPGVRAELVRLQRQMALRGRSVLEGRDISTVVVPEAKWKFYLVASLDERVERRRKQYALEGKEVDPAQLRNDVIVRDERDRSRAQGALKLSPEAIIFDTSEIPLDEVVETIAAMIENQPTPAE